MTNRLLILALLLIVITLVSCQYTAWEEFSSLEGAFSVVVPGVPVEQTRTTHTPLAGDIDAYFFIVEQKDFTYMIVYADYPEDYIQRSDLNNLLDMAIDGAVAASQTTLLSESDFSFGEYLGREATAESAGGKSMLQCRMFLVGNRLYQVVVVFPKEQFSSPNIKRFLDSFILLEK